MAEYEKAFTKLINQEGTTFTNDPNDHGGATKFGITQHSWDAFMADLPNSQMPRDVADLKIDHAHLFYMSCYWTPLRCTQVTSQPLAEALFSIAVNQGAGTVAKRLQALVGVTPDGAIGPKTLEAINAIDAMHLLNKFLDVTQAYYDHIVERDSTQSRFARGWQNRIDGLRSVA